MQIAKERYSKEKAANYYAQNKEAIKEKSIEHYKRKTRLKSAKGENIKNWFSIKNKR